MTIIKNLQKEPAQCRIVTDFHIQIIMSSIAGSWDLLLMGKYCIVRIVTS